MSEIGKTLL